MDDKTQGIDGTDSGPLRRFEEALPIALLRTREAVMAKFRPHLAEYGMTEQQWRVIRVVQQRPGIDETMKSRRFGCRFCDNRHCGHDKTVRVFPRVARRWALSGGKQTH